MYGFRVSHPVLLTVDSDEGSLRAIQRELVERYERSYRIVCVGSASQGEAGALVLVGDSLDGVPGSAFLAGVRKHHPHAQRAS
jgi:thioredoxin reductase (NADPH)